ncbi:DUF6781 family protein [Sulfurimonas sp.]|jgi:hypothetical protein|uniref:DUF6781 family protein n=1 Tax=Sulfurimonas sp. TaxID=2022749 RepID=UPI0025E07579|nr:DUF6781 family protein [Sulfurimonas sp.]MCK9472216.1 hypothetical protein [Sulfurimonas sp.]MDD3506564.1 hypothetical protein [Sulfurimonas sp.]
MGLQELKNIELNKLNLHEMKDITTDIIESRTKKLRDELEDLLLQKEFLEKSLQRKSNELQELKYAIFNDIESLIDKEDAQTLSRLHQVKLQSIDLFDLLSETVEGAIITALEKSKDSEAKELIQEIIKELTYQTIKEGTLNTIRVRKILSTILHSSINIAEATPNTSEDILEATLKGMRAGLLESIDRFKKRLAYMPLEAKHILIEDYDTIMEDLNQTDTLFLQVVQTQANESDAAIRKILLDLNKKMHYDLQELIHISKETAQIMRERFSALAKTAVKKADTALKSETAKEAKRMGIQAWGVAKTALGSAIKSAKSVIEPKDK